MTLFHDLTSFWTTVAQIVPVLALGWVIEARRLLLRWDTFPLLSRAAVSVAMLLAGIVLYQVESWALVALSQGLSSENRVRFAILGVLVSMSALALNPLLNLLVAGKVPLWFTLWGLPPWTKRSRGRRIAKRLRKETLLTRADLDANEIPMVEAMIEDTKAFQKELLGYIDIAKAEPHASPGQIETLKRAEGVARRGLKRARKNLARCHELIATSDDHLAQIDEYLAATRLSVLTPQQQQVADGMLASIRHIPQASPEPIANQ